MSVCPLVWIPLALGVVGAVVPDPHRRAKPLHGLWNALCLVTLVVSIAGAADSPFLRPIALDRHGGRCLMVIGAWAAGFGWAVTDLGRGATTLAGLIVTATSRDLLGLTFGLELVRLGTTRRSPWDQLPLVGLAVGVASCLGVLGTADLEEMRSLLAAAYSPSEPHVAIGRPGLMLVGGIAVWLIAAVAPMATRVAVVDEDENAEPLGSLLAAISARNLAAMFALGRVVSDGLPGLQPMIVTLMLVLALIFGGLAVGRLADRQRLDRIVLGLALWQAAGQLMGLATALSTGTGVEGLAVTWLHDSLVLAAITAAVHGWVERSSPPAYLDELRGLGGIRPRDAVLFLIPLGSVLGGPLLAGSWLRMEMLVQLFSTHTAGANDLLWPRADLRLAAVFWGAGWIVALRAAATIGRVMLLETPFRSEVPRRSLWPTMVAVAATLLVVISGCWPHSLIWLMHR